MVRVRNVRCDLRFRRGLEDTWEHSCVCVRVCCVLGQYAGHAIMMPASESVEACSRSASKYLRADKSKFECFPLSLACSLG